MNTFVNPASVAIPMSGLTGDSHEVDKALVYDDTAGHYILMSAEIAQTKVAIAKRAARMSWSVRVAVVLVLCLVSGILGAIASKVGGDSWRTLSETLAGNSSRVTAPSNAPAQVANTAPAFTVPTPVAATPASAASAPVAGPSTELPLAQAPAASQPVLAGPGAPPAPPASTPAPTAPAVASQAASTPSVPVSAPVERTQIAATPPTPAVTTSPQAPKPTPAAKPAVPKEATKSTTPVSKAASGQTTRPTPVPATPKASPVAETDPPAVRPAPVPAPVPVGVQRVGPQGVYYFDGTASRLFTVGSTLPNGERVVDVDEASATYATDKGVRQLRATKP